MSQKNKYVLVTGGAGYIGSHVCYSLKQSGYTPVCFDNLSTGHEWAVKFGPLVKGDLLNPHDIQQAIERYQPMGAIHLASLIQVGESTKKPLLYYEQNVLGSIHLVQALVKNNVHSLVFSSSAAVYGETEGRPIKENHPRHPLNPYGRTKHLIECFLEDISSAYNLRYASLRYFNAAGAFPSEGIGEAHNPETHLIPLLLKAAIQNTPFEIFGDNYATKDGTCIRDYVHVLDLAEAHVSALQHIHESTENLVLNLGSGTGSSIKEVVSIVEDVSKKKIDLAISSPRPGDPAFLIANTDKAKTVLGWHPQRNLKTIINDAFLWEGQRYE